MLRFICSIDLERKIFILKIFEANSAATSESTEEIGTNFSEGANAQPESQKIGRRPTLTEFQERLRLSLGLCNDLSVDVDFAYLHATYLLSALKFDFLADELCGKVKDVDSLSHLMMRLAQRRFSAFVKRWGQSTETKTMLSALPLDVFNFLMDTSSSMGFYAYGFVLQRVNLDKMLGWEEVSGAQSCWPFRSVF
jgi:hypothetical protein